MPDNFYFKKKLPSLFPSLASGVLRACGCVIPRKLALLALDFWFLLVEDPSANQVLVEGESSLGGVLIFLLVPASVGTW